MGDLDASMKSQVNSSTLRGKQVPAMKARSTIEQVPYHGPRVVEHRDEYVELADGLDSSVALLLKEHSDDLYLAYRAHMYTVQKQIYDLRHMARKQEKRLYHDPRIRKLEGELEWFMTEALRLDQLAKMLSKEVENWSAKATELEKTKMLHVDAVKGHRRVNKVLNMATDNPKSKAGAWPTSPGAGSLSARGSPRKLHLALSPKANDPHSHGNQQMDIISPQSARSISSVAPSPQVSPGRPTHSISSPGMKSSVMSANGGGSAPLATESEQYYVDTIRGLQDKLKKQQRETRLLKAARAGSYTQKSHLEEFFLKCIHEARKDLDRGQRLSSEKDRVRSDPEKVLETLLGSESTMVLLHELIFPHRVGQIRHLMEGDRHMGLVSSEILNSAKQKQLVPLE